MSYTHPRFASFTLKVVKHRVIDRGKDMSGGDIAAFLNIDATLIFISTNSYAFLF